MRLLHQLPAGPLPSFLACHPLASRHLSLASHPFHRRALASLRHALASHHRTLGRTILRQSLLFLASHLLLVPHHLTRHRLLYGVPFLCHLCRLCRLCRPCLSGPSLLSLACHPLLSLASHPPC